MARALKRAERKPARSQEKEIIVYAVKAVQTQINSIKPGSHSRVPR